jgi:hypothetical protein
MTFPRYCPRIAAISNPGGISLITMMSAIDRVGNGNPNAPGEYCY